MYASCSLASVEQRYLQTEREAITLVWACEMFHAYLYGIEFELHTDHKPLKVIYGQRYKPCVRIERWILRMQPYRFKVIHIPGKNSIADSLSCVIANPVSHKTESNDEYARFIAMSTTPNAMTTKEIEHKSAQDEELRESTIVHLN